MLSENKNSMKALCKKYNLPKQRRGSVLTEKDRALIQRLKKLKPSVIQFTDGYLF